MLAIAACASRTPTERERAVAKLPPEAQLLAAADGAALAPFRPVIDAARPFMPRTLDCVLDAAITAEAAAVAVVPRVGTTITIITRAHVARCPALSRIAHDTFVATVGAGVVAETASASPLADPRWARAKHYLVTDPIAIAFQHENARVVAAAQPKPLDGWLAIDAPDIAPVERAVRAWIDRQRTTALAPFAAKLAVELRGTQLLVRSNKLEADELALFAADVLRTLDAPAAPTTASAFTCPSAGGDIVRCADGTHLVVRSLAGTLHKLASVDATPAIAGGDVIGIRLTEDAEVLLRRGDVILGLGGHRITSTAQLHDLAGYLRDRTALAVRRDGADVIIELSE